MHVSSCYSIDLHLQLGITRYTTSSFTTTISCWKPVFVVVYDKHDLCDMSMRTNTSVSRCMLADSTAVNAMMSREIMNRSYSHLAAQTAHITRVTMEMTETLWNDAPLQRSELQTQPMALPPLAVTVAHSSFSARLSTQNRFMILVPETQQTATVRPVWIILKRTAVQAYIL